MLKAYKIGGPYLLRIDHHNVFIGARHPSEPVFLHVTSNVKKAMTREGDVADAKHINDKEKCQEKEDQNCNYQMAQKL